MRSMDRLMRVGVPLALAVIITTLIVVGINTEPGNLAKGYAPDQPIPFSHKLHAGDNKIPCQYCHSGARRSRHAGIPAVGTCMNCHRVTKTDSPVIQTLTRIYEKNEPLAWNRIHRLPDHVYFDHRPHVADGIACQECHGKVQEMEKVKQVMSLRMGACLSCHRGERQLQFSTPLHLKGPTHCWACHR